MRLAKRIMAAAVAWIRKYLMVASTARGWCFRAMRGRIARVFISRPIHARSQWELENVKAVPRPRVKRSVKIINGCISKGGTLTNMFGVWAQKLI